MEEIEVIQSEKIMNSYLAVNYPFNVSMVHMKC